MLVYEESDPEGGAGSTDDDDKCVGVPATKRPVDVFRMTYKIMADTGCPLDLIGYSKAAKFSDRMETIHGQTFNTANGPYESTLSITARLKPLINDFCEFFIMKSSPSVFSVGKRCKNGFCFIWLAGLNPCMITPDLNVVLLDVVDDVP